MKISGFTIARQAVRFGYPLAESLRSLLPLVDELVVGVGDGDDGTWEMVRGLDDPKVRAFRSTWDMSHREGGRVLSVETNKALERCSGDWAVYLQADEVLHEDEIPVLRRALERHLRGRAEGLRFLYYHFYGSYQTVQDHRRKWYRSAVRAVRTGHGVVSVGDAYGFKVKEGGRLRSLRKADSGVHVYHYGWVRPPGVMLEKQRNLDRLYHDEAWIEKRWAGEEEKVRGFYRDRGHLKFFRGTHPGVMAVRAGAQDWTFEHGIERQWPDWLRHLYVLLLYPLVKWARKKAG